MTITRDELLAEVQAAIKPSPVCSFAGCDRLRFSRGLCASHAQQLRRCGKLSPLKPYGLGGKCFCGRRAITRGYCSAHYIRVLRYGNPQPDKPLRRYGGGDDEA